MQLHIKPPPAAIPLYVALDGMDVEQARTMVKTLGPDGTHYKIGTALMEREGAVALGRDLKQQGKAVFWDKKLYDIGTTMEETVAIAAQNGWDLFTVHCKNKFAANSILAGRADAPMKILTVTVPTDHTQFHLCDEGLGGYPLAGLVASRAQQAEAWGLDGVIASAQEAQAIRNNRGDNALQPDLLTKPFLIVTPGIRREGDAAMGQARTATPQQALRAGVDAVVVGKPITTSTNPRDALVRYKEELRRDYTR